MKVIFELGEFLEFRKTLTYPQNIGLVPTMGALHEGHLSLMQQARAECDHVVATIFVNPTQFGPNEDFSRYPRTLDADLKLLEAAGVDTVFVPQVTDIYPRHSHFFIQINDLSDRLCGASRPGHMNGVVQVVSILFHLIRPDTAYFGRKDYQQLTILASMAAEFHFQLTVKGGDTVREPDGLALSSRNRYLTAEQRKVAPFLYNTLSQVRDQAAEWASPAAALAWATDTLLNTDGIRLDYFEILNGRTLAPVDALTPENEPVAFVAAYLGTTRLIDNVALYGYPH